MNWQWWDLNPRLHRDWSLNPAPYTTRPHYLTKSNFVSFDLPVFFTKAESLFSKRNHSSLHNA